MATSAFPKFFWKSTFFYLSSSSAGVTKHSLLVLEDADVQIQPSKTMASSLLPSSLAAYFHKWYPFILVKLFVTITIVITLN